MESISLPFFVGPLLLLVCVGLVLFGIFCCQVYIYWYTYEEDSTFLKSYVFTVWILECVHSALCMHMLWAYFVLDIGNPAGFIKTEWSAGATVWFEILIVSMAQSFSIYRIWQLSERNWYMTAVPSVFLLVRIIFGFITADYITIFKTWSEFATSEHAMTMGNCSLALAALVDIITTSLLTYYLHQRKSNFRGTKRMIQKMMFYTVNTGIITALFSTATVFVFNFVTPSLLFAGMVEVLSKLYANVMLALLNARRHIREQAKYNNGAGAISLELRTGSSGSQGRATQVASTTVPAPNSAVRKISEDDDSAKVIELGYQN